MIMMSVAIFYKWNYAFIPQYIQLLFGRNNFQNRNSPSDNYNESYITTEKQTAAREDKFSLPNYIIIKYIYTSI